MRRRSGQSIRTARSRCRKRPAAGWPATILAWLWWGYMACMLLVPVFARHDRLPLAGLSAFMLWVNFGVAFVCILAVAGMGL
ncbi:hypothetical protein LYSHEL_26690 [Lysobacter helvus]|uniref:Uncharacterized protein n=2 Tax=Lysobacteraceae TaxID=32033 RepID=A0ABN6FXI2_9GAMM|nr:hypothetical protein LYSCAS_26680 [Lysobacter caseinilyticus]BCT96798.1 hypothetical protein LYSHEL_26690 [Lysobacter helvus]